MENFQRRDIVAIKAATRTPEGYLVAPARVAKVGVLTYFDHTGKPWKELVPESTLFDKASMETLHGIPVTNLHPDPKDPLVNSNNAMMHMRGFTMGPAAMETDGEDKLLGCGVKIMDGSLIKNVDSGMQELSLGYETSLDLTPGTFNGEAYDAVQTKRVYNHLAVVPAARAGHKARLKLDSAHNLIEEADVEMVKIKVDGKEVEVPKETAAIIEACLKAKADAAETEQKRAEGLQGELDTLKKSDAERNSEKAKKEEIARIDALVKERASILADAKTLLAEDQHAKLDGLDNAGVIRLTLETVDPETKLDGKSEDYMRGVFNVTVKAKAAAVTTERKDTGVGAKIVNGAKGAAEGEGGKRILTADEAEAEARHKMANRWREPLHGKK